MALNINGTTGISGVDGSASAPAVTGTDSNTGINFASDTVNINTGGVTRATIDSSGALDVPTDFPIKVNGSEKLRIDSSGNVGIGTTSPSYILDVVGDGGAAFSASTNSTNGQLSIVGKNSSGSVSAISRIKSYPDGSSNQSHMAFETRNSSSSMVERMRILSNGVVDIYSAYTNPVGGTTRDLYVRNDGRLGYLSSIRASKTNIVDLTDISWLNNLKPKAFNMRKQNDLGEYTDNYYDEFEYGLIAEDVESVNKELCSYSSDNALEAVQYRKLVVPLLKAVQELTAKIEVLETKVAALEAG